jgi:2-amino-4-hydroxy-6-hydroxymethyldihydropteridine diphosphokinase
MTSIKNQDRPGNRPPWPVSSSDQLARARKPGVYVALGANLSSRVGLPEKTIAAALNALSESGIEIVATSKLYRTPAWPDPSDPSYVNAVSSIETALPPSDLLTLLHRIETSFGRVRSTRNAPRTLDLDLIDYRGRVEEGPPVLPHPRMADRAFVLIPLADIAPGWRHPVTGRTVGELLSSLPESDRSVVTALPERAL